MTTINYKKSRGGARPGAGRPRKNDRTDIRIRKGQSFMLRTYGKAFDYMIVRIEKMQAGNDPNIIAVIKLVTDDGTEIHLFEVEKIDPNLGEDQD